MSTSEIMHVIKVAGIMFSLPFVILFVLFYFVRGPHVTLIALFVVVFLMSLMITASYFLVRWGVKRGQRGHDPDQSGQRKEGSPFRRANQ